MIVQRYAVNPLGPGSDRIVGHTFACDARELNRDTIGRATFADRGTVFDVWSPPKRVADAISYAVWVERVELDGFTFEERWLDGRLVETTAPAEAPASS